MFYIKAKINGKIFTEFALDRKTARGAYAEFIDELLRLEGDEKSKIHLYEILEDYLIDCLDSYVGINLETCLEREYYYDSGYGTWVESIYK